MEYINKESVDKEIRNLVMMLLLPKRLHFDGAHQFLFKIECVMCNETRKISFSSLCLKMQFVLGYSFDLRALRDVADFSEN